MMDYSQLLDQIIANSKANDDKGIVADYIPELAKVDPSKFGIYLIDSGKNVFEAGDSQEHFSVQSISKVLSLALAFSLRGDLIWQRVGVEPSGDPFNHLSLLERENGIPRNPLINAGAIVIADILVSELKDPKKDFLAYIRKISGDPSIDHDAKVAQSEKRTGFKNYAAAYLLKSYGNLENDVETVLDFYFHQCALSMSCAQLSQLFFLFMNRGRCLKENQYLSINQIKRINAIMLTCGFYDEAGDFAFEVGLPGKSGVGGGIVALLPNEFCVAVWSPGLNAKGNSKLGMMALEYLTTQTGLSIF